MHTNTKISNMPSSLYSYNLNNHTATSSHIHNGSNNNSNPSTNPHLSMNTGAATTSNNYRKYQHRRIHTEVDQMPTTTQHAVKYQPYQQLGVGTYRKEISKGRLDPQSGGGYGHIINTSTGVASSTKKFTPTQPQKQTSSGISSKPYKVGTTRLGTGMPKYLKTQPDHEQSISSNIYTRSNMNNINYTNTATSNIHGNTNMSKQSTINSSNTATNSNLHGHKKQLLNGKYEVEGVAGKGTFGVVYYGRNIVTGKRVALKKVLQDKKYKNRQLQILKQVKHSNILEMKDYFLSTQSNQQYLNVVMDYYSDNMYQVIKKKQMNPLLIKLYTYQIIRGLNYLNFISIAHRDIKPQNILVDRNTHKVVICDFGSAKKLVKGEPNIAYICSRCYRAPELIFGATEYTPQIDMWSLGCVLVQMINGQAPFLGDSQIDQLLEIIKILGTPQKADIEQMNPKYDLKQYRKFPNIKSVPWSKLLKTEDALLVDLVTKILQYSPKKRLTAAQALNHPYFDELKQLADSHEQKDIEYLKKMRIKELPELYDFSQEQIVSIGFNYNKDKDKDKKEKEKEKEKEKSKPDIEQIDDKNKIRNKIGKIESNISNRESGLGKNEYNKKQSTQDMQLKQDEIKLQKTINEKLSLTGSKMIQKRVGTGNINNYTGQSTAGNNNIKNISNRFEYR